MPCACYMDYHGTSLISEMIPLDCLLQEWLVVGGASGLCQVQYYVYLEAYPEKISVVPLPDGSILLKDVVSI